MTLSDLKQTLNTLSLQRRDPDLQVVITTTGESSYGARPFVPVKDIYPGIDWESGQLRIEPEEPLYRSERRPEDTRKAFAIQYIYDRRMVTKHHCPMCMEELVGRKNFCACCGQKVTLDGAQVLTLYDYRTKEGKHE